MKCMHFVIYKYFRTHGDPWLLATFSYNCWVDLRYPFRHIDLYA